MFRGKYFLLVILLVFALAVQILLSIVSQSVTTDEPSHVSRGYYYVRTGSLVLNIAPPLMNILSGLALCLVPNIQMPAYIPNPLDLRTRVTRFADEFFWESGNDADQMIFWARVPVLIVSLILAVFVFKWARELYGVGAGLLAIFLYAFDPNLLAHSSLATADLGVTCLVFLSLYWLWRFCQEPSCAKLTLAGINLGLALTAKQSGLMLIIAVPLLMAVNLCRDFPLASVTSIFSKRLQALSKNRLGAWVAIVLFSFSIAFVVMLIVYRFEFTTLGRSQIAASLINRLMPQNETWSNAIYRFIENIPVPLPTFISGLTWLRGYYERGYPGFLMGMRSYRGWHYYFLVAAILKTPLPTLILFLAAAVISLRTTHDVARRELFLWVPILLMMLLAILSPLSAGYRYILPALPFAIVFSSRIAQTVNQKRRWLLALILILCAWLALSSLRIHPHYLAYFNELVGGADNGYKYLVDSNLDWGQDLKGLKTYMDEHQIHEIYLAYFGSAPPSYYGIEAKPLPPREPVDLQNRPPEFYAISATYLQIGYLDDADAFAWLKAYEPIAKIGYSIFVYRLP